MKNKEWKLIPHSYPIADTGDYDGHWELTNGNVSMVTKDLEDDDQEIMKGVVQALNEIDSEWEDGSDKPALLWEINDLKKQVNQWKEVSAILYEGYKGMISGMLWTEESVRKVDNGIKKYEEIKQLLP